jgi:hypothetical protein
VSDFISSENFRAFESSRKFSGNFYPKIFGIILLNTSFSSL